MAYVTAMQSWRQPLNGNRARHCSRTSIERWKQNSPETPKTVIFRVLEPKRNAAITRWFPNAQLENACAQETAPRQQTIADVRDVVAAILESRPLPPPTAQLDQLLTQAVNARGTPGNIREWAERLAADVGDLTD